MKINRYILLIIPFTEWWRERQKDWIYISLEHKLKSDYVQNFVQSGLFKLALYKTGFVRINFTKFLSFIHFHWIHLKYTLSLVLAPTLIEKNEEQKWK